MRPLDVERLRPLALTGFMGAGKTAVGMAVAALTGAHFIDLDRMIESVRSELIPDLFARLGEAGFRVLEVQLLPVALRPGTVVATGGGTLMRHENRELLAREAYSVWLDAPFELLWERIGRTPGRPLAEALGRDELEALFESRRAGYAQASVRIDATAPVAEVAQQVVQAWTA